nr:immunoglobulin heavy chain junction region [Macaca mulatta]MOX60160.1 immunoglobulin heavy chain junction region [Macaca mulatta]MOX60165.1 immunoglobulin heavy chain junction region [Macaca mulatta]MOX60167.1 immunoglobulin heavy chain junction region [Macaca mulatta]MOX60298.1 immunoglobulin heavy chain junction region [Macaca mulatta]
CARGDIPAIEAYYGLDSW